MLKINYKLPLIQLQTDYAGRDKCTSILGGTWSKRERAWEYLLTPVTAMDILRVFEGELAADDLNYLQLLSSRLDRAQDIFMGLTELDIPESKTAPWRHQIISYNMARALMGLDGSDHIQDVGGGFMPGHDMGVGKSKIVVDIISNNQDRIRKVLIVCPNPIVTVWSGSESLAGQMDRHATDEQLSRMLIVPLRGASVDKRTQLAEKKRQLAYAQKKQFIAIVNYESVWREPLATWIRQVGFDLVVGDELHRIKGAGGKASKYFANLSRNCKYRMGPTGTPAPHALLDIYGSYRFLDPGVFGTSYIRFRERYATMGGYQNKQVLGFKNTDHMNERMYLICHRVLSKDVLDLPEFIDVERVAELSPGERRMYDDMDRAFCVELESGTVTAANAMVKLLRLQELCSGFLDGQAVGETKKRLLADVLEDFPANEPIPIFAWFKNDLASIREVAESQGRRYCELSGRINELDKWQSGHGDILGVQIQSGKEGVDFTRAHYDIFYATGLSLGSYQQCRKRTDRQGQTQRGTHIHLLIERTVDIKILKALRANQEVIAAVIDQYDQEINRPVLSCAAA